MKTYLNSSFPELNATATAWEAAGYIVRDNGEASIDSFSGRPVCPREIICLGIGRHGMTDQALYWAAEEYRRRVEESLRTSALNRDAEALSALATAIRGSAESQVAERIIGALTERTQYAVRQQLKGTVFSR